jgi:23S rRNA (adenine2503-C2)-methyltransferase
VPMMNLDNLNNILEHEPRYRANQTKKAIFKDLASDWMEASALPLALREKLNKECPLDINGRIFKSRDGRAIKALIILDDGLKIETVLMRYRDGRSTICVSSQVGCPLACKFCATGKMDFKRNLTAEEIVSQVLFFARYLKNIGEGEKISNIVFMGMGEPFLNYENVLAAIKLLNDKDGFGLGSRRFSISTAGVIEGIKKLSKENLQVNLAISLHAADDKSRSELMPINKKYPLKKIFAAVDDYIKNKSRRVMFEYLLLKGVNDSAEEAKKLAALMKKRLYILNLISYNPTGDFTAPSREEIKNFKMALEKEGITVTERYSFGQDIQAACGQLASSTNYK